MALRDWENWMWLQAENLLGEAERIRWSFLESAASVRTEPLVGHPVSGPPVNVIETEDALWVVAAVPGVKTDGIQVEIQHGWLILSGRRDLADDLPEGKLHIYEISSGEFERRIRLPLGCRFELGEKKLSRGLLSIELRKRS